MSAGTGAPLAAPSPDRRPPRPLLTLAVVLVLAAGVVLRFVTRSDLWLDEALTVHVARLPVGDLLDALRHDGAPPLGYLLLHGWMRLFGEGDVAVRALSGVLAVATIPLLWLAVRRWAGRTAAWVAVLLLASSPFAIRYATETRMYALVALLTVLGWLAVTRALERPTPARLVAVAVVSGLLLLTHYWAIYLLAVTALVLAPRAGPPRRVVVALAAGGLLFLPWLPSFWYQLRHTGTPWAEPPGLNAVITTVGDVGGGAHPEGRVLALVLIGLVALALLGRPLDRWRIELDLRTRLGARGELAVAVGTLLLAIVTGLVADSAYASRYASIVVPLLLGVAAIGTLAFAAPAARAVVVAVAVVCGLAGGLRNVTTNRTQASQVADAIVAGGREGDVVVSCPDQLGPAVHRLLPARRYREVTFPRLDSPARVDWVDYAARHRAADDATFVRSVLQLAGPATVWLVWAPGYRTLDQHCESVRQLLFDARPQGTPVLEPDFDFFEHHALVRYPS